MKKIISLILACALVGAAWIYWHFSGLNNLSRASKSLEEEIITKYQEQYTATQLEFENKVYIMIDEGKMEYLALSSEERDKEKYNLAFKYMGRAAVLEKECDKRVDAFLEDMKEELKNHGLSVSAVKVLQQRYKEEKNARRQALMEKALGQLK